MDNYTYRMPLGMGAKGEGFPKDPQQIKEKAKTSLLLKYSIAIGLAGCSTVALGGVDDELDTQ